MQDLLFVALAYHVESARHDLAHALYDSLFVRLCVFVYAARAHACVHPCVCDVSLPSVKS